VKGEENERRENRQVCSDLALPSLVHVKCKVQENTVSLYPKGI
jgi:hypothetical protein